MAPLPPDGHPGNPPGHQAEQHSTNGAGDTDGPVTRLDIFRFDSPFSRLWVFLQMGLAHLSMRAPGLRFYKLMGTGSGEGFTPRPNWGAYAILTEWETARQAGDAGNTHRVLRRWQQRAAGHQQIILAPYKRWGQWGRAEPFQPGSAASDSPPGSGPVAVLTRATLKPHSLATFWRHVPPISDQTVGADGLLYKIGLGEVPWVHQVTFSLWRDEAAIQRFAYRSGAHAKAVSAARAGNWFHDQLFARFRVIESTLKQ